MKLDGLILLHLLKGDLFTRVWFGISLYLGMNILYGTLLIDRSIREMFPAERKVGQWYYNYSQIAILTRVQQKEKTPNTQNVYYAYQNYEHTSNREDSSCV